MDDDLGGSTLVDTVLTGYEETDRIEIEPDAGLDVITDTGLLIPITEPGRAPTEGDWPPTPREPGGKVGRITRPYGRQKFGGVSEFRT